jgi:hypothetical protein
MANQSINVLSDRFNSLQARPKAWLLVLTAQPYLNIGDTLTVVEVDNSAVPTGRTMYAVCTLIHSGEPYNLPKTNQLYYFKSPVKVATVPSLFKQNTLVALTGTLTETIVFSFKIVAGTMAVNDFLRWFLTWNGTNNANNKILKCYFNTSSAIAGATLVQTLLITTNVTTSGQQPSVRNLIFKNSVALQRIFSVASNNINDESLSLATHDDLTINFAVDQYFIVTLKLANTGDTANLCSLYGYIIR